MLTKQKTRPVCSNCGLIPSRPNGISKLGFKKWHKYCVDCSKILYNEQYKHLQYKENKCDVCGFVAIDKCQLELVYKDNNKKNKKHSNLKTYCKNCVSLHKKKLRRGKKSVMNMTVDADIRIS